MCREHQDLDKFQQISHTFHELLHVLRQNFELLYTLHHHLCPQHTKQVFCVPTITVYLYTSPLCLSANAYMSTSTAHTRNSADQQETILFQEKKRPSFESKSSFRGGSLPWKNKEHYGCRLRPTQGLFSEYPEEWEWRTQKHKGFSRITTNPYVWKKYLFKSLGKNG